MSSRKFPPKMDGEKTCRTCSRISPTEEFGIFAMMKDGRNSECKECTNERERNKNPESKAAASKRWKDKNKDHLLDYQREWQKGNREHIRADANNRYATDTNYRIAAVMRSRVRMALNGKAKCASTMELVGCSAEQLIKHLGTLFQVGMSWVNYGKWHVDHIHPCASFDLSREEEQRECFHFSNLQPLWAEDNRRKGAKDFLLF